MMKSKTTTTGVVLAVVGLLFAVSLRFGTNRERFPNDLASFSQILANDIQPGASLAEVEALLGPGAGLTVAERTTAASAVLRWQKDQPAYYADGVLDRDVFLRWPIPGGCTLQLQFRDDRLINHAPDSYLPTASK